MEFKVKSEQLKLKWSTICLPKDVKSFGRSIREIERIFNLHFKIEITVELGYNDHGYNEFTAITNKILRNFRSQIVTLLHKASRL